MKSILSRYSNLKPQTRSVLSKLIRNHRHGLSASQAQSFGWHTLRARVHELREAGFNVTSQPMQTRRGVRYVLQG